MNEDLVRELALLKELGYTHLDLSVVGSRLSVVGSDEVVANAPDVATAIAESTNEPALFVSPNNQQPATDNAKFDELRSRALACTACRLAGTRTNVVFGVGDPNADLMFIGEAPGRDEDLKGEPFVGRAGQLLTDIIKAMKLTREQVYIANVIKCRPPENRNPEPDEMDECRPFIQRQVELIQPKVIVTLGKFGLQSLTGKGYSISAVRGQWLEYRGIKLMPTFHPAYLLRTPAAKKDVWTDMKKVMTELGINF
ncbi:MAG: uracil-DNA glycosylase [Thermoanaerobaculia bacterium]